MLRVEHISKTFNPGTINEKKALDKLSLHLTPGEFVTVIGGNGAGKSTMLNAVAGAWPVDEGRITIDGVDVTALPDFRRAPYIGRVFQDPMIGTAPDMWLEENLALALRRGKPRGLRWGISDAERRQYRNKLAALDPATAAMVLQLSDQIVTENNLTALMITHNMSDAIRHGSRLIMMHQGKIILDISGEDKRRLTKRDLLDRFAALAGVQEETDSVLLS